MKKTFLAITALAAMLFAGCTSSDELTTLESVKTADNTPTPVQFGTYVGKAGTRALTDGGSTGIITTTTLSSGGANSEGFGVFGYLHASTKTDGAAIAEAPNFMYNENVSHDGSKWTYSPLKYWPNGTDATNTAEQPSNTATQDNTNPKYLSFYAYAPYISTVGTKGITAKPTNSTTNLVFTYKLDPTNIQPANNVDFLWGMRGSATYNETSGDNTTANTYNVNLTKQKVEETVDFLFKHALAKIGGKNGLKVVADFDGNGAGLSGFGTKPTETLITVNSVTIKDRIDGTSTLAVQGNFDISTGEWSSVTRSQETSQQALATITTADMLDAIKEQTPSNSGSGWSPTGVTTTAQNIYKADPAAGTNPDGFFLIPSYPGQQLEIAVEYVVRTYDNKLATSASGGEGTWTKVTQTITNYVTLPALEVNKYYTLVIHIGLTSVKFSAEVADWSPAGDSDTEVIWLPSIVASSASTTTQTLASGAGATVYSAANNLTYALTITGMTSGAYTVTTTGSNIASNNADLTSDGTNETFNITLTPNRTNQQVIAGTITVTDASSKETTLTIIQNPDATFTVNVTNIDANGVNGSITVTGGTSPSTTAVQTSASSSGTLNLSNLSSITSSNTTPSSAETYTVTLTITDGGNDFTYSGITINKLP